jgi:hypothetical protein
MAVFGQTTELYVFKDERKEHLELARKAREAERAKAVSNDFYMRVRTQTSLSTAKMEIEMKKSYDAEICVTDMDGTEVAQVFKGELKKGQHEFTYTPEGNLRKPFVCELKLDGKTEAMKVVKFNSF